MKSFLNMKKNIFNKNIIFFYILLIIFKLSLNEDINLSEGETPFFGVNEERYVSFYLNEEIKNKLNNTYIHFYTYPQNTDNINSQQIIFSSIKEKPQASNAENYSYKFSKNANLFINYNNIKNNNIFYLTIKCFKYPCYFILVTKFEKNYANLNLNDDYSYFISGQKFNTMKFKIPSSLSKEYSKNKKHSLTISVTNPTDADSINLYLFKNNEINNLNVDNFKTPMGKIFTFLEENINKSPNNSYILEIESIQNQFISISIKTSIYDENSKKLINEIIPNSNPKYTYINNFNNIIIKEECFKINENYLKDNLISDDNDNFLYASIEFFTSPNYGYLNYGENKELHKINNNKESLNVILNKESNKYPDLCFNTSEKLEYSFMIQINHISKKNENIDINYPLTSGFIHSRIIPIDNLLIYTHYSDIHFSDKLSYNFRVVKGQPEIYIYNCKTYPKCYNNITELRNNKDITKLEFKENINYFHIYNINKEKDLAPYGPNQNLLYIFCPKNNTNFCELDILVYTNYDQIILPSTNNNTFYSNLKKKDEKDLYKFHIPKGKNILKKIEINLNISNDNALFESALEDNKTILLSNQSNKTNMQIIEFKTINSTSNNDLDIPFNIKSKKDNLYYKFEYKLLYDEKKEEEKKKMKKKKNNLMKKKMIKVLLLNILNLGNFLK